MIGLRYTVQERANGKNLAPCQFFVGLNTKRIMARKNIYLLGTDRLNME
jgi:hypothetical protein